MIENDSDLDRALARLDVIWSAREGDANWTERYELIEQICAYEDAHVHIPPPSPEAAIAFRKDQEG